MNYKESLLELIKGKVISGDSIISLSLQEIADAWNRKVIQEDPFGITKTKFINYDFLQDVLNVLKNIENEELIKFKSIIRHWSTLLIDKESYKKQSISDITSLSSLQDKIFLETTERLQKVLDKDKIPWFNPKNNSLSFSGEFYKPRSEKQGKLIRILVGRHQTESSKGVVFRNGGRTPENELVSLLNSEVKELRNIKKQFNRIIREKGFPLRIDSNSDGILLIKIQ